MKAQSIHVLKVHPFLFKGTQELFYFLVVNVEAQPVPEIKVSEELKLIKRIMEVSCELNENNILEELSDVFD